MSSRQQPVAARPLALLTLAVLAAHLLLLGRATLRQPPQEAAMRPLETRVVWLPQPAPVPAAPPQQQQQAAAPTRATAAVPRVVRATEHVTTAPLQAAAPVAAASSPAPIAAAAEAPAGTSSALALAIPASVRLLYEVTGLSRGKSWKLQGELLWKHDGSDYEATLASPTPVLPLRSLRSTGRITEQGLAPSRFSDKGRGERATHFERERGALIFSSNAPQLPLSTGVQDRLSVFLQLASMLAADPGKFPAGTGIAIVTAGTRDAEPWRFTVEGDETLALPGGEVATRKLVRLPGHDLRVELWLGTAADYVPLRIRLTQANGDYVDQQWSSTDRP
jgi:Protein of unknown function (DUF3108)